MTMKKAIAIISVAATLAVAASGVAIVSAQKVKSELPVKLDGLLTSEEYQELKEHPERQPSKEAKPAVPEEEQRLIDAKRDQLVDLYHESYDRHLKEFEEKIKEDSENEWIFEGEARADADEDMAKALAEEVLTILKKYDRVYQDMEVKDFYRRSSELISTACEVLESKPLTLEEQVTVKFFIKQLYMTASMDTPAYAASIEKKVDLDSIPYIDLTTQHSYEIEEIIEVSESESSV
jgi:hypothetical protein